MFIGRERNPGAREHVEDVGVELCAQRGPDPVGMGQPEAEGLVVGGAEAAALPVARPVRGQPQRDHRELAGGAVDELVLVAGVA
ncbi:hypothetical protein MTP03_02530 [Tsukamurella sp. PLM1]|nr:hypothetical protein MTP03_02530 [Tsukamurella sp. PLM1]